MNCNECNKHIATQRSGFVVCPYCGNVNIAPTSVAHSMATAVHFPQKFTPVFGSRIYLPRISPRKLAVYLSVFFVLVASGTFAYQNEKATTLLALAKANIAAEDYAYADSLLDKADNYLSTPANRQQIKDTDSLNERWIASASDYEKAEQLHKQGKLEEARDLLAKIDLGFPGNKRVQQLLIVIQGELDSKKAATTTPVAIPQNHPAKVPAVKTPVAAKRYTSTAASAALAKASSIAQAEAALNSFMSQYGVSMQVRTVTPSSYVTLYDTYNTLNNSTDLANLKAYGGVFIDEWSKYPTDWIKNSNLQYMVFVKDLAIQGTRRAATPDPFGNAMYYDVGYGSGEYAREVIHHEFGHQIEYEYFNSYNHSDPTWQSYNPAGFRYGNGGASCYIANTCLLGEHVRPGFATGYAMSAIEEDKAETYAYLMTTPHYKRMKTWLPKDLSLTKKVNYYKGFIASHSTQMKGDYFEAINR
jgi:hypothetical protein